MSNAECPLLSVSVCGQGKEKKERECACRERECVCVQGIAFTTQKTGLVGEGQPETTEAKNPTTPWEGTETSECRERRELEVREEGVACKGQKGWSGRATTPRAGRAKTPAGKCGIRAWRRRATERRGCEGAEQQEQRVWEPRKGRF